MKTTPADPLAGTSWKLASHQGPAGTTVPAAPKASAPLAFADEGIVGGSTGCNQFGGNYTVDSSKLSITLGPMTLMACAEPLVNAQEAALVQLLPQVSGFDQSADKLVLAGPDKVELLTYSAGLSSLEGTLWKATGVNNGTGGVETTALTESLIAVFGMVGYFTSFDGCNDLTGTSAISGDVLTLRNADGATQVVYRFAG